MVEREMADQMPGDLSFGGGRTGSGRSGDAADSGDRCADFQGEIGFAATERHQQRQVPVGTQASDSQLPQAGTVGCRVCIHDGDEDVAPSIRCPLPFPLLTAGYEPRCPPDRIIGAAGRFRFEVLDGIKGTEDRGSRPVVVFTLDIEHGMHLDIERTDPVDGKMVLEGPLAHDDTIRLPFEQVDDRAGEQDHGVPAEAPLQPRLDPAEQEDEFEFLAAR